MTTNDFYKSAVEANKRNAEMRDEIDAIFRKHLNDTGENIRLREELATARKARDAAQELLEATRSKLAGLEAKYLSSWEDYQANAKLARTALDTEKQLRTNDAATIADLQRQLREAEGQLKAQREAAPRMYIAARGQATVARGYWHDIQELQAENKMLRAQIETMPVTVRGEPTVARKVLEAENAELRRTLDMAGTYLKELQALLGDTKGAKG